KYDQEQLVDVRQETESLFEFLKLQVHSVHILGLFHGGIKRPLCGLPGLRIGCESDQENIRMANDHRSMSRRKMLSLTGAGLLAARNAFGQGQEPEFAGLDHIEFYVSDVEK